MFTVLTDLNVDQARFVPLLARAERDALLGHGPDSDLSRRSYLPLGAFAARVDLRQRRSLHDP